jgi:hypothetical protein
MVGAAVGVVVLYALVSLALRVAWFLLELVALAFVLLLALGFRVQTFG